MTFSAKNFKHTTIFWLSRILFGFFCGFFFLLPHTPYAIGMMMIEWKLKLFVLSHKNAISFNQRGALKLYNSVFRLKITFLGLQITRYLFLLGFCAVEVFISSLGSSFYDHGGYN